MDLFADNLQKLCLYGSLLIMTLRLENYPKQEAHGRALQGILPHASFEVHGSINRRKWGIPSSFGLPLP